MPKYVSKDLLISIIIPVYNVESFIERCLVSVFSQTYKNIEIVLVNDCSTDESIIKVHSFVRNHVFDRIKILEHNINMGLSAARNTGIKAAQGEYVFFLDSDDELPHDAIEILVELALKYAHVDLIQGCFDYNPKGWFKHWNLDNQDLPEYFTDTRWITERFFNRDVFPTMACNRLIKKSILIENSVFFKEGIMHEDEHWNFFLVKYINSMAYTKQKTYVYFQNKSGITLAADSELRSNKSFKVIIADWAKNITPQYKDLQLNFVFKSAYDLYEYLNFKDYFLLECLFPLFPLKFGKVLLSRIGKKEKLSSFDKRLILIILKIEKMLAKS